jgi:hypothetical protein
MVAEQSAVADRIENVIRRLDRREAHNRVLAIVIVPLHHTPNNLVSSQGRPDANAEYSAARSHEFASSHVESSCRENDDRALHRRE